MTIPLLLQVGSIYFLNYCLLKFFPLKYPYFCSTHFKHFILGDFWNLFQLTWFYIRHLCDQNGNSIWRHKFQSFPIRVTRGKWTKAENKLLSILEPCGLFCNVPYFQLKRYPNVLILPQQIVFPVLFSINNTLIIPITIFTSFFPILTAFCCQVLTKLCLKCCLNSTLLFSTAPTLGIF